MPRAKYDPEQTRELKWLGQAVARLRDKAGMTQRELAEAAGRQTYSQVSDLERGASSPGWLLLVELCETLGVSMEELGRAYDGLAAADKQEKQEGGGA